MCIRDSLAAAAAVPPTATAPVPLASAAAFLAAVQQQLPIKSRGLAVWERWKEDSPPRSRLFPQGRHPATPPLSAATPLSATALPLSAAAPPPTPAAVPLAAAAAAAF
eukprot:TRINITY_DN28913_c0_g1_i1.p2 TRINITY_DN28913_c0_g1~~TRINITY_DN28913_c0_g1_i1.p2  ORF type:complete len:108 (-),score=31.42 TRINITY_DN28913_c0_g1_i1:272-595(-)